jgi:hypothetical protein
MRKILTLALLIVLLGFLGTLPLRAEQEAAPAAAEPKALTSKQVSQEMAEVWCAKMEQCAQEKSMSVKECQKILFKSFKTGFDRQPKDKPIQLERAGFDQCKTNVAKGTCEGLKGAKALPGCEFISLLGQ